ncbi:MAG TPA: hypothetical protein DCX27_17130 [Balneola sp.]|nr:hypothetical protein [Balneola sp.]
MATLSDNLQKTIMTVPIGKFEGASINIISAEDNETVIDTGGSAEPRIVSIVLNESIFQPFIVGTVILDIPNGYLEENKTRITSQDVLVMSIATFVSMEKTDVIPGKGFLESFIIYNTSKSSSSEKTTRYRLDIVTPEGFKDSTTRVVKSFSKRKRSDIVKNIYTDYIQEEKRLDAGSGNLSFVTETLGSDFSCVLPNWSPSKCISWITNGSIDSKNEDCVNFFFFQRFNDMGRVESVFTSFTDMIKEPVIGVEDDNTSGYIVDILYDAEDPIDAHIRQRRTIKGDFSIPDMNSTKYNAFGTWGGTLYFYDQTRKKYFEKVYNYTNNAPEPFVDPNTKKFIEEENQIITNRLGSPDSFKAFIPKQKYLFSDDEKNKGVDKKEDWLDLVYTQRKLNIYFPLEINIVGDADRRVGECVMFSDMQVRNLTKDQSSYTSHDQEGRSLGGKYLISDVQHQFIFESTSVNQEYTTKLTLMRDGAPK